MYIVIVLLVLISRGTVAEGRQWSSGYQQTEEAMTVPPEQQTRDGETTMIRLSSSDECPIISLRETSVMLRESMLPGLGIVVPLFQVKTQCQLVDGNTFRPVYTPIQDYERVVFGGYRFIRMYPDAVVGTLQCGQVLTCDLSIVSSVRGREFEVARLASGSCSYDYRNFIQWGFEQKGLGFTCSEGSAYYTLTCEECQYDDFPWELAYNMSGPILEDSSSPSFNYIMVITAVSVVGFAILISFVAILIRSRRRSAIDLRVAEMVSRTGASSRAHDKPPELFIVSEDGDGVCLPSPEYSGPIAVFHASKLENPGTDIEQVSTDSCASELQPVPSAQWSLSHIAIVDIDHAGGNTSDDHDTSTASSSGTVPAAITTSTTHNDGEEDPHRSNRSDIVPNRDITLQ